MLIANDEQFKLEMLTFILKDQFNIESVKAVNGQIALEVVNQNIHEIQSYSKSY